MKALLEQVARHEQLVRLGMDTAPPLFRVRYELRAILDYQGRDRRFGRVD